MLDRRGNFDYIKLNISAQESCHCKLKREMILRKIFTKQKIMFRKVTVFNTLKN